MLPRLRAAAVCLALLTLITAIRAVPGVRTTETFMYLDLVKQTFGWGAH